MINQASTTVSPARMRRVAFASLIGTTIEFYDYIIYATAAALVFGNVFFPALGPTAGTVASFASLGVAFIARPFGSILFGHYGDRLGRKGTLVTTLLIMGISTVVIGLLPTADQIGIVAPIALIALRFLQGLAVGGEWAGATLLTAEYAPKAKRGFYSMFPQFGFGLGFSLASASFLLIGATVSGEAFAAWGWRIPFLASAILVVVGLYMRLKIEETPVFKSEQSKVSKTGPSGIPFKEAFKRQPREVLLGSGVMTAVFTLATFAISYLTTYGTKTLGHDYTSILTVGVGGGLVFVVAVAVGCVGSDKFGRRKTITASNVAAVIWAPVLFLVLDIGTIESFTLGAYVTLFISGVAYGPVGAYLPELFDTRFRYTAAGLCYNISGVLGGAVPPLVAATIIAAWGGLAFGLFMSALCLISLVCTLALRETRHEDLREHAHESRTPQLANET